MKLTQLIRTAPKWLQVVGALAVVMFVVCAWLAFALVGVA